MARAASGASASEAAAVTRTPGSDLDGIDRRRAGLLSDSLFGMVVSSMTGGLKPDSCGSLTDRYRIAHVPDRGGMLDGLDFPPVFIYRARLRNDERPFQPDDFSRTLPASGGISADREHLDDRRPFRRDSGNHT